MQVRDLMNPSVVSITPGESAALAARLLSRHNVGSLPVCGEDGHLRGIVTAKVKAVYNNKALCKIVEVNKGVLRLINCEIALIKA